MISSGVNSGASHGVNRGGNSGISSGISNGSPDADRPDRLTGKLWLKGASPSGRSLLKGLGLISGETRTDEGTATGGSMTAITTTYTALLRMWP